MNNTIRLKVKTGYADIPRNWIQIHVMDDEDEATCICVIETRNGTELGIPHFVFKYDHYDGISNEEENKIYSSVCDVYPEFAKKVLAKKVKPVFDEAGNFINSKEWDEAPLPGIFLIMDAVQDYPCFNWPYGVKFYRYE